MKFGSTLIIGTLALAPACADDYVAPDFSVEGPSEGGGGAGFEPEEEPNGDDDFDDHQTPAEICAKFEEQLGDDALDAEVYAELGTDSVHMTFSHSSEIEPGCEDMCADGWVVWATVPLPHHESFDLADNKVLGDFVIADPLAGGDCACLAGLGLTRGEIQIVAMDANFVCGWFVEDQLFDVQGGFSTWIRI